MNNTSQVRLSYLLLFFLVLILIAITVFNSPNYTLPTNTPSSTPIPDSTNTPYSTPTPDATNTPYSIPTPAATHTPIDPQALQAAKDLIRTIFQNLFDSHIATSIPKRMYRGQTKTIELILSPSLSEAELVARMLDQSSFINNPINQKIVLVPKADSVSIVTENIEITPRMMASLKSVDPEAFVITAMHGSDEQLVIFTDTTTWRWSITAKKTGWQVLELGLNQIIKYDGQEIPQNVTTIIAYVYVYDTFFGWLKSLDWKWIATFVLGVLTLLLSYFALWLNRDTKKKNDLLNSLTFPLEIRTEYKDTKWAELIDATGRTLWKEQVYDSPIALAKIITDNDNSVNHKKFWKYQNPETKKWEYISTLEKWEWKRWRGQEEAEREEKITPHIKKSAWLKIVQSEDESRIGQVVNLKEKTTRLGRKSDNDVSFPEDTSVSRFHAVIENIEDLFILTQVVTTEGRQPAYGTFVNGLLINGSVELLNGDVIRFGKSVSVIFLSDGERFNSLTFDDYITDNSPPARMAGDSSTDAPPPTGDVKKKRKSK